MVAVVFEMCLLIVLSAFFILEDGWESVDMGLTVMDGGMAIDGIGHPNECAGKKGTDLHTQPSLITDCNVFEILAQCCQGGLDDEESSIVSDNQHPPALASGVRRRYIVSMFLLIISWTGSF